MSVNRAMLQETRHALLEDANRRIDAAGLRALFAAHGFGLILHLNLELGWYEVRARGHGVDRYLKKLDALLALDRDQLHLWLIEIAAEAQAKGA